jgi:hypothetical protein
MFLCSGDDFGGCSGWVEAVEDFAGDIAFEFPESSGPCCDALTGVVGGRVVWDAGLAQAVRLPPRLCVATTPHRCRRPRVASAIRAGRAERRAPVNAVHYDGVLTTGNSASGRSEKVGYSTGAVVVSPEETNSGTWGWENKLDKSMDMSLRMSRVEPHTVVNRRRSNRTLIFVVVMRLRFGITANTNG